MILTNAEFGGIKEFAKIAYSMESIPKFVIPYYQRPYEWDKTHIENLVNDFITNRTNSSSEDYFIGATVLVTNDGKIEIVDGQQRITTLYLMYLLSFLVHRSLVAFEFDSARYAINISSSMDKLLNRYNSLIGEVHRNEIECLKTTVEEKMREWVQGIQSTLPNAAKIAANIIKEAKEKYCDTMGLSANKFTDDSFIIETQTKSKEFWDKEELAISYSRTELNSKLKEALSKITITIDSDGEFIFNPTDDEITEQKEQDEIVGQYVQSVKHEYEALDEVINKSGKTGVEKTEEFITLVDAIIDNMKLCAIVTANEEDAYALFESLNDRSQAVDDLNLIKNLFLKAYFHKSNTRDDKEVENGLSEIDDLWNDHIFTKENREEVSLFAAVYLTGDVAIDGKNGSGVRKAIGTYLDNKKTYTLVEAKNDIAIYKMVRAIIDKAKNSNDVGLSKNALIIENNDQNSITLRCLSLLFALGYQNVATGLINVIIKKYISITNSTILDSEKFKTDFLNKLILKSREKEPEFITISKISYDLWRVVLAAKDYKKPREFATEMILNANKETSRLEEISLKAEMLDTSFEEFDDWLSSWNYSQTKKHLRIKIMFIRLLKTSINQKRTKLIFSKGGSSFCLSNPGASDLDHLEPKTPDFSRAQSYFTPPKGHTRKEVVNSLGNFMLLDNKNNIAKDNVPIADCIPFYETMFSASEDHWILKELKKDISNRKLFNSKNRTPKMEFFNQRKERLIKYFTAILKAKYDATDSNI